MPETLNQIGAIIEKQVESKDNIAQKVEAYWELYGGTDTLFFPSALPVPGDPDGANLNSIQAFGIAVDMILKDEIDVGVDLGAMTSGKTTLLKKIYTFFSELGWYVKFYKHTFDVNEARGGTRNVWHQGGGGTTTDIEAGLYHSFADLSPVVEAYPDRPGLIIVDEAHFSGEGDPDVEIVDNRDILYELIEKSKESNNKIQFGSLDFNFRGEAWQNALALLEVIEGFNSSVFSLQGRCTTEGCKNNSFLTQRWTRVADHPDAVRPSAIDGKVVRVGTAIGADDYSSKCFPDIVYYTRQQADDFDAQFA